MNLLIVLGLAPWAEEVLFRRGLHATCLRAWDGAARRWAGVSRANLAVALTFGLAHALARDPWLGAAVVGPALVVGVVFERCGSVAPCVLLHAAFNGLWLAVAAAP